MRREGGGRKTRRNFSSITMPDARGEGWWLPRERRWGAYPPGYGGPAQDFVDCRTVRAFRRHLRKYGTEGRVYELEHAFDPLMSVTAVCRRRKRRKRSI